MLIWAVTIGDEKKKEEHIIFFCNPELQIVETKILIKTVRTNLFTQHTNLQFRINPRKIQEKKVWLSHASQMMI